WVWCPTHRSSVTRADSRTGAKRASACSTATTSRPSRLTSKDWLWRRTASRSPASPYAASVSTIDKVMTSGDVDSLESRSFNVVIGSQLAKLLGVGVGDEIGLYLAEGRVTLAGFLPRHRTFTVSGIFDAGMYEYDRGLVFVSFDDAAKLFSTDGEATGL